jgi:5-methylcytosine-specific restriction endonuclease McrA
MDTPYIVTCQKCKKNFRSSDPKRKYHYECKPEKERRKGHIGWGLQHTIMARDKMTCQECGIKYIDNFEIHHIDRNWKNNKTNNLILLCSRCHGKAHRKKIKYKVKKVEILKEPPCNPPMKKLLFKNIKTNC